MALPVTLQRVGIALAVSLLVVGIGPASLWAQSTSTASIFGKVVDQSGGIVPGVLVRATSPALQVPEVTATTEEDGNYRLANLPAPGVYRVSFELSGFQTFVQNDLNLPVGFAARLDANLKVGSIAETVEVSGVNPVVDIVESSRSLTLSQSELSSIPKGGSMLDLYAMAAGVTPTGKPDVGDSNMGYKSAVLTYGALLNPTIRWEGVDLTQGDHTYSAGSYLSSYNVSEAQFKNVGQNADIAMPGFTMDTVVKSGGNDFHGSLQGEYENKSWQSNNITPELAAQGLSVTNPLKVYWAYAADFSGRILRDKLWFYYAQSKQLQSNGAIGWVEGPNAQGCWTCADAPVAYSTQKLPMWSAKINYQPTRNLRANFVWASQRKSVDARSPSQTTPKPSTSQQDTTQDIFKGGVQWTATPHLLIDVMGAVNIGSAALSPQPGMDKPGQPSSYEQTNRYNTGPAYSLFNTPNHRYALNSSASYLAGHHQLSFGANLIPFEMRAREQTFELEHGNYLLRFNRGLPYQIVTYNYPFIGRNGFNSEGIYFTDTWTLGRVTLNYGVRWDRYHAWYPDQHKPAGGMSLAGDYPGRDIMNFQDFVPRIGASWDVTGGGKTVVKGSFGMFGDHLGSYYPQNFNPNSVATTTYKWSGPCVNTGFANVLYFQPNTSCDATADTLATLNPNSPKYIPNNPNYVSATGGLLTQVNTDMKQPRIQVYTARVEQQLVPNVAVSFGFVHDRVYNKVDGAGAIGPTGTTYNLIYPNRPYSAYTVVVPMTDPGTGKPVNVYTYPASYKGSTFDQTMHVNSPNGDTYTTFEVAITKRYSRKWNGTASFWTTKNRRDNMSNPISPNDVFNMDETRSWELRTDAMYSMPWGINVSGMFRLLSGPYGQRTAQFTSPLLQQGTVTMNMEEYGAQQSSVIPVTNLKVAKMFRFGERIRLEVNYQMFNAINSSAAISTNYLTGPTTYGRVTDINNPRVQRISMKFQF